MATLRKHQGTHSSPPPFHKLPSLPALRLLPGWVMRHLQENSPTQRAPGTPRSFPFKATKTLFHWLHILKDPKKMRVLVNSVAPLSQLLGARPITISQDSLQFCKFLPRVDYRAVSQSRIAIREPIYESHFLLCQPMICDGL